MFFLKRCKIRTYEIGLLFREGEFRGLLTAGTHWFFDPLGKVRVDVVSILAEWRVRRLLSSAAKRRQTVASGVSLRNPSIRSRSPGGATERKWSVDHSVAPLGLKCLTAIIPRLTPGATFCRPAGAIAQTRFTNSTQNRDAHPRRTS
jgi:hypothetical protein